MIFFLGFFFFQSDRPTQYQETHSRVNEEKKGMALRRILFSNDTFSAQQIYQWMIMSIFTHCGYNSLGWSESRKSMIRSIEKRSAKSFPRNAVRSIGLRAIFCQGRGGGNPFAQKIIASCPNFYETVERKLGPCNKIGRTGT